MSPEQCVHPTHHEPDVPDDVERCWQSHWVAEVYHGTPPTAEEIKGELYDLHMLSRGLPRLYDVVTGGRISKPTTVVEAVISEFEDRRTEELYEAASEARAGAEAELLALRTALAEWLTYPPRSYHSPEFEAGYGYDVAQAEVRSILRDPSGENPTPVPSLEEAKARLSGQVASGEEKP